MQVEQKAAYVEQSKQIEGPLLLQPVQPVTPLALP